MSNIFNSNPYKGTRDFYPENLIKRNYIFSTWKTVLHSRGFEEYETSLLENAEIYIAKSGGELGGSQLYNFKDKGDRFVALRPEQTPSLARLVANKFNELRYPLRWFSIPNCFRYERPQKGRLREHWQLNVDIIGLEAGQAELEIMYLVGEIFKAFGANNQQVKILYNHRGILDAWISYYKLDSCKVLIYKVLDDWFKKTLDEKRLELASKLNDEQTKLVLDLENTNSESYQKYLEISGNFPEIKLILDNIKTVQPDFNYQFSPFIIRGIAYYTGIVFEAFDLNPENSRALFGGGRYDNLMELFDKKSPAIGFGMGDVTMHEFLENWNLYQDFKNISQVKVGLIPSNNEDLIKIYSEIIPQLISKNKTWDIDYDYQRAEKKRIETLYKRGCDEIVKI